MTDLLKIMFGTAALLFGWTLLEELPKMPSHPPPPKETPTADHRKTIWDPFNSIWIPNPNYTPFTVEEIRQIYPKTVPPNQFDPIRRVGVYTQG